MADIKKRKLSSSLQQESFNYNPLSFLRAHSKNDSPKDKSTQLWDVVFEPDPEKPGKYLPIAATCGGNIICVTNLKTGEPILRYVHKDTREEFYSLAYTTFSSDSGKWNCLASSSSRGEIRFFHPKNRVCIHEMKASEVNPEHYHRPELSVNSVLFHPQRVNWLITVHSFRFITIWDIGFPKPPNYEELNPRSLFTFKTDDITQTQAAFTNDWLLVSSNPGVIGWHIDVEKVEDQTYAPVAYQFKLPMADKSVDDRMFVECLAIFDDWKVATKCAMHGKIYIWDLKATIENAKSKKQVEVSMLAVLNYTHSAEYFMNLGCLKGRGVVVCGDDKGMIWLYDMRSLLKENAKQKKEIVKETTKIPWPVVSFPDHEKTPKKSRDGRWLRDSRGSENADEPDDPRKAHIINRTVISEDFEHIIGVTNKNMVCIWKMASE